MGVEINKKIRSGIDKVDNYIVELENELTSFEAKNIKKLIIACDEMAGEIANDMVRILRGDNDLTILSDTKDNVLLDKMMKIISGIKHFKDVSDAATSLIPKEIEEEEQSEVKQLTANKKISAFEAKIIGRKS